MDDIILKSAYMAVGFFVHHLGGIPTLLLIGPLPVYIFLLVAKLKGVSYRHNRTAFSWLIVSVLATLPIIFVIVTSYLVLNQWG